MEEMVAVMIYGWLEEADQHLMNGAVTDEMDMIPFSANELEKAQIIIGKVMDLLKTMYENHE